MYTKMLKEKKNDLIVRAEEMLKKAEAEKRELTEDEAAELAEIRDNVRRIKETLKIKDDVDDMDKEDASAADKKPADAKPDGTNPTGGKDQVLTDDASKEKEQQETRAFENYIRGVVSHERAQNLTPTNSGAIIPTTIANKIIKKIYDISPILEKSTKYNVKGNLDIPYYDESTGSITVAYQDEFTPISANAGNFTSITLTGFLAGALSLISRSLVNNSQVDIVAFVIDEMAEKVAKFIENELLNGTPKKVEGMSALANSITSASSTAITADELISLQGAVKDRYQNGAIWIMSPKTRDALRTLKDKEGRYLLNYDITSAFGTTLLGHDVYASDNMPDIGAGKTVIYYGDMSGLATKFSEDLNIEVLREKYADQHAIGIIGWFEFDSKVENVQKIAKLTMPGA